MLKSYPSLFLLGFVVAGIVAAYLVTPPLALCVSVGVIALALAVWQRRKERWAVSALLAGLALTAVAAVSFTLRFHVGGTDHIRQVLAVPTLCRVFGQVDDWPEMRRGRTEITIEVDSLSFRSAAASQTRRVYGRLLLKVTDTTTLLQRGDRIAFSARVYPVRAGRHDDFDYGRYLNLRGISAQAFLPTLLSVHVDRRPPVGFWPIVDDIRETIRASFDRNLSPVTSALARGFLIGETRDIPPAVYTLFRDSGTLHLLAVSGANVALVIIFFLWVMRPFWLGPATRSIVLLIVIAVFAGVSYGDPSVMRASIMAALVLGARLLGRPFDLNNIIAVTALIVLLVRPAQLFDVGFQLSFVTAWGLVFVVPRLAVLFQPVHERRWYRWLVLPAMVALVAQLFSTPLIALYFERIPVISLAANLAVVPLVSVGVIGILVLLVADLIWPLLGAWVGSLVNLWLNAVVIVLQVFGGDHMPVLGAGALFASSLGSLIVVFIYVLLTLTVVAIVRTWARKVVVFGVLLAANAYLVAGVAASLDGDSARLRIERIPGGLSVTLSTPEQADGDLVITNLTRTAYAADSSMLVPNLRRQNVSRLRHLVVLAADFDAMDYILRLAQRFSADTIWIARGLAGTVSDAQGFRRDIAYAGAIVPFGGRIDSTGRSGCHLGDGYVGIRVGDAQIEVVESTSLHRPSSLPEAQNRLLVISGRWTPNSEDWRRIAEARYDRIICSEIAQASGASWPDVEFDTDAVTPDFVQDLSRLGMIEIDLPR
ncbi:MAG: ComEC/Rec2 family competence protein [Candidatus Zixiibacteriota bacterium]